MLHAKTGILALIFAGLFLSFGIVVFAYFEQETADRFEQQRQELQQRIQEQSEALKARQEEIRKLIPEAEGEMLPGASLRERFSPQEIRERVKEHKERFETERKRIYEEAQERKEEFEARAQEIRETTLEEVERRKEEFREKLAQIREERHKQLAAKLSERMNNVNQHMSDAALRYLEALELVLSKIEARTGIVEEATGADLSQVRETIASARQRIEEARTAVIAQKSKEYVIEIESQETLGQDIRNAMQELREDHRQLRQEVLHPLRNLVHDIMLMLRTVVEQEGAQATDSLNEDFEEEVE